MKKKTCFWIVPILQTILAGAQLAIAAAVMAGAGMIPEGVPVLLGTVILADSAGAGAFLLTKLRGGNALLNGGICGGVMLLLLIVGGLLQGQLVTTSGLWKALAILLAGETGAIFAILRKKKVELPR